jgi:hypothetical protein
MASSAIGFINIAYGNTGPTGARGAVGPTGPDGLAGNAVGPIGPNAPYIDKVDFTQAGVTITLSDSSIYEVLGSFRGQTLTEYTKIDVVDPLEPTQDGVTVSFTASGAHGTNSFIMRGISGSGSLVVTEDSQAIYIDSIYTPGDGAADSASLSDNTLIYLKKTNQISSTTIGTTYGNFYNGTLNFQRESSGLSFSKLLPRSKVKYISPIFKTPSSLPQTINIDDAGVFYIRTPNGISAFSGNFYQNEIISFTLITESDDLWHFPSNVYFENGENYLTCGKSIINLSSFDRGNSWYAVVAARGVDGSTFECDPKFLVGSCCYYDTNGNLLCEDFTNKNTCDALAGTFNALQPCEFACGITAGVCCSNGSCLENRSYSECIAFGGKYFYGITCGYLNNNPNGDNSTRLCYDKCIGQKVACCKNGQCIGDEFTKFECEDILGGIAFPGSECASIDCCLQNVKSGACCVEGLCFQKTLLECKALSGIFLGEGEACGNINCDCYIDSTLVYGACCNCAAPNTVGCSITTQNQCLASGANARWTAIPNASPGDNCMNITAARDFCIQEYTDDCFDPPVKCCRCINGITDCSETIQSVCDALGGNSSPRNAQNNCTVSPCNKCTSNTSNTACADCNPSVLGRKCICETVGGTVVRRCVPNVIVSGDNTDPDCISNPGICSTRTCAESPTCDVVLANTCIENFCIVNEPETTTCPTLVSIPSIAVPDCSNAISIPHARFVDMASRSTNVAPFQKQTNFDIDTPECGVGQDALSENNALYGFGVKDFYIPIKPEHICSDNPNNLQLCIQIDLPQSQNLLTSFRAYVLRTWYPKYFSTNYAAALGLTYMNTGQRVSYIDPTLNGEETSVWGSISRVSGLTYVNQNGVQFVSQEQLYNNLSSFIGENGLEYINYQEDINNFSGININTTRMIEELNCPLLGYNPRGRYLNFENLINPLDSEEPATIFQPPRVNLRNTPGYRYANVDEHSNPYYYSSVNLGGRIGAGDGNNSTLGDFSLSGRINNQTYIRSNNTAGPSNLSYLMKSRPIFPVSPADISDLSSYELDYIDAKRTYGYTDYGFCRYCYSNQLTNGPAFYIPAPYIDKDPYAINGIGYYVKHSTLNRFANKFFNARFYAHNSGPGSGTNLEAAEKLIKYGFSFIGHPLTVDYESDVVYIPENGTFNPAKNVFRYNAYNSDPSGGNYINEMDFNTNTFGTFNVKKSPIYKTRETSIICDTGPIDSQGNYYDDVSISGDGGHLIPYNVSKRKYFGAIGTPYSVAYAQTGSPFTVGDFNNAKSECTISQTQTGIKICIKLKNYKNYILTDDQIGTDTTSDSYNKLKDKLILRNNRVLNYKNSLRVVLFSNPVNPYSTSTQFNSALDSNGNPQNPFLEYKEAANRYITNYHKANTQLIQEPNLNINTFKYNCLECEPTTNSQCSCATDACVSCNINEDDKKTNMYGAYPEHILFCLIANGYRSRLSGDCCVREIISEDFGGGGGGGLGSVYKCSCDINATEVPDTEARLGFPVVSGCRNCNDDTPCSCKSATVNGLAPIPGFPDGPCPPDACPNLCTDSECCSGVLFPGPILPGGPYVGNTIFPAESACPTAPLLLVCSQNSAAYYNASPALRNARRQIIRAFFSMFGFEPGADLDYNFINLPQTPNRTIVVFKLLPKIKQLSPPGSGQYEQYAIPRIAPPYLIKPWTLLPPNYSADPNLFDGVGYIRNLICDGTRASPSLHGFIPSCAINENIQNGVLQNPQCDNYCDAVNTSCSFSVGIPNIIHEYFYDHAMGEPIGTYPAPIANVIANMGDVCDISGFFTTNSYKKFFTDETDFICVNVDCTTINCAEYQDCVP